MKRVEGESRVRKGEREGEGKRKKIENHSLTDPYYMYMYNIPILLHTCVHIRTFRVNVTITCYK